MAVNSSDVFDQVKEKAVKARGLVIEISTASEEQAEGIGQINTAIAEIDKVTQRNAAIAEETASASSELSSQAAAMLEFVNNINRLAGISTVGGVTGAAHGLAAAKRVEKPSDDMRPQAVKQLPARPEGEYKTSSRPEEVIPFDEEGEFEDF